MPERVTESTVEEASLEWLEDMDYERLSGPAIAPGEPAAEREDYGQVVLEGRLRQALHRLNPQVPAEALEEAFRKLTRPDSPSLVANNHAFHQFLVNGVSVEMERADGSRGHEPIWALDFENPENNEFLAVNQFTVVEAGPSGKRERRPDVVVFVNGLPLAVIELKNAADENATIWSAFNQLQTYKEQIPSLFAFNEALVVSDGAQARIGTLTGNKEWFLPWRTIEGEAVADATAPQLEVLLKGVFDKRRFLDLIRHFIVFEDAGGGTLVKKMAGYHQYHAVNAAVEETVRALPEKPEAPGVRESPAGYYRRSSKEWRPVGEPGDRRVGVVWHTQGSGKSLTMAFYAGRVVLHPAMENPTLVVITDRNDLDDQLFGTFARCHELLRQKPEQAQSRAHLRELLRTGSGGVVFTTIQKFMPAEPSPRPSPTGRGRVTDPGDCSGRGSMVGPEHYRGGFSFSGLVKKAKELRQKQTSAEELLWALLRNRQLLGLKFRRQHQFGDYILDFYCAEASLAVEADGPVHNYEHRRKHDHKRDAYLKSCGVTVLRFSNEQILNETEDVLKQVAESYALTPDPSPTGRGIEDERGLSSAPREREADGEGAYLPSPCGRGAGGEGAYLPSPCGRGAGGEGLAPLSLRRNIIVIADEAHRSQYDFIDGFARHMRTALPNASFIGFTGTPIELADANTRAVFGDYISIYDIQRAVADGATVPIYYESRLAKIELDERERPHLDADFEEATEGEEVERKEKLKTKWAALEALVGAEKRLNLIAEDLVKHFEQRAEAMLRQVGDEGKAMIVCMSRRICVELYNALVKLRPDWHGDGDSAGALKIVMTGSPSDPLEWQPHVRSKPRREELAKRFKDPADPFKIVIVRDMWLTGFDAPSLHTMYVDKPMRGHGLMQAIARVNRVFRDKPGGLVVDYLGLAHELKAALRNYTDSGGGGETAIDQEQAVAAMREKYEICCGIFHGFDWSAWASGAAQARLAILPAAQEHVLAQKEGKTRLAQAVGDLSKAFALAVPHEEALAIRDDVGFFQAVKAVLMKGAGGNGRGPEDVDHAIRQIVSKAVSSDEVIDIFAAAGLKKPDISILSDEFLADVRSMPQRNLAVEMLEKLLKGEIRTRGRKNVVQARSFMQLLEAAIRKYQNRAIETAQVIEELIALARQMRAAAERGEQLGLNEDEVAFYDALADNQSARDVMGDEQLRFLAQELMKRVRASVTIDWQYRENARAQIRVLVKRILRQFGYPPDMQARATELVLEQAEVLCGEWAVG